MNAPRVVELTGVHNFRDYGGYALVGGGRLRRGLLWRSGQHHEADDVDLATIDSLGLAHVFDLRTDRERENYPCRRPPNFAGTVHFAPDDAAILAPHVAAASGRKRDAETTRENMRRSYLGIPFRPKLVEAITNYFQVLASSSDAGTVGASMINCLAGKDRTGFAVAMLHTALGVHHDDIVADYLLTNTAGDPLARIAAGGRAIAHIVGDIDEDALRVIMSVEAEWLDIAFARIREEHGSVEAYQAATFGVDDALRKRLRANLSEA